MQSGEGQLTFNHSPHQLLPNQLVPEAIGGADSIHYGPL